MQETPHAPGIPQTAEGETTAGIKAGTGTKTAERSTDQAQTDAISAEAETGGREVTGRATARGRSARERKKR